MLVTSLVGWLMVDGLVVDGLMVDGSVVDESLVGRGMRVFRSGHMGVIVDITLVLDVGDVAVLIGRVGDNLGCDSMCFLMVDYLFSLTGVTSL